MSAGLACPAMVAGMHELGLDSDALAGFPPSLKGGRLPRLGARSPTRWAFTPGMGVPPGQLGGFLLPAMPHWDLDHFVVLERVKRGRALIHNPPGILDGILRSRFWSTSPALRSASGRPRPSRPAGVADGCA